MPTYRTIHTTYGLQRLAAAITTGVPINLVEMAVGDGNGNPVEPTEGQAALVRETYRAAINRVFQDPDNPLKFVAELIVPSNVGGFTIREVGLFDSNGSLFAVGNTPPAYKPTSLEGAFSDGVYRMEFLVTNAGAVTIQADPAVAVATHLWVINNVTPGTLIPGGTTGQLLAKNSNADGDTEWVNPDAVNVVVDVIEEPQVLAALQTEVILATVTTYGLAVYISGVRIHKGPAANEWMPKPADPETTIVLGQAYADGTKFLGVQNEPAGSAPFPLIRNSNLSDVPDKALGRTNLGVFSKEETRQMAPASAVVHFARSSAPTGWLKANGAAVSRVAYADLFAAIGTYYGVGDGFTTFNLPDLRGEFLRGWDDGRGLDAGRTFGVVQGSQNLAHDHALLINAAGQHNHFNGVFQNLLRPPYGGSLTGNDTNGSGSEQAVGAGDSYPMADAGNHAHSGVTDVRGGNEARPRNVALLACIKY